MIAHLISIRRYEESIDLCLNEAKIVTFDFTILDRRRTDSITEIESTINKR